MAKKPQLQLDFLKYSKLYFGISIVVLSVCIISLVTQGLKLGIDFTGGSLLEVSIDTQQSIDAEGLESTIANITSVSSVQPSEGNYLIRAQNIDNQTSQQIQAELESTYGPVEEVRFETVGPTLGRELLQKTLVAVGLGSLLILGYVAYQFKEFKYGVCAILAMFHDTLVVVGTFSLLGYFMGIEVDTLFVTAVLTTLSFSVHDTIVVYDRIRESLYRTGYSDFELVVNKAIAETLGRSINNSMTIIFMLTALFLLGGDSVRWFVFALLVGTITGTYSSTFTAAPLLVLWERVRQK